MTTDVRWQQRFQNYCHALKLLERCVLAVQKGKFSEIEELALIQSFEMVYELGWNCIKDFCIEKNKNNPTEKNMRGSKDAIFFAEKEGLISSKVLWDKIIESRIKTVHTYDEKSVHDIAKDIVAIYYPEFLKLQKKLNELKDKS